MRLVLAFAQLAADLLWPRRCAACDEELPPVPVPPPLCGPCAATLLPIAAARSCSRCAAPLPTDGRSRCGDCRRLGPAFDRVTAAYEYGGALTAALHRLKWQGRDDLGAPLGALLAEGLLACAPRCDVLVPVPLHSRRLRQRGYNQAALLCRAARRTAGVSLPLSLSVLHRQRATPPALHHDPAQRQARVAGAFRVPPGAGLEGQRVLLCDDVVTTGATAHACALALLSAGAIAVEVLTLCRAAP